MAMSREEAVAAVLGMHADRPGVGRLCQELLADLSGSAVTVEAPPVFRLPGTGHIGSHGNPYGRKGRPA